MAPVNKNGIKMCMALVNKNGIKMYIIKTEKSILTQFNSVVIASC